jgi:phosphate/phosphite/phosphonate ABC transporter binding protein
MSRPFVLLLVREERMRIAVQLCLLGLALFLLASCAQPVQNGAPYRAQFNVACTGEIESFQDLRGKTIAFVEPASMAGYLLPHNFLLSEHGIDADTAMQAMFAGSHEASVLAVYNGDVDVSASFEDARTLVEADFPDVMERVCIPGYTHTPGDSADNQ